MSRRRVHVKCIRRLVSTGMTDLKKSISLFGKVG